jgi:hypothetical protein
MINIFVCSFVQLCVSGRSAIRGGSVPWASLTSSRPDICGLYQHWNEENNINYLKKSHSHF